ncbi:hypothetical protein AC1031_011805 [Aphanomyces cochlioides]|nr:hypothetical protein AC1031_011805 [Aphanomyces cochlioides]
MVAMDTAEESNLPCALCVLHPHLEHCRPCILPWGLFRHDPVVKNNSTTRESPRYESLLVTLLAAIAPTTSRTGFFLPWALKSVVHAAGDLKSVQQRSADTY